MQTLILLVRPLAFTVQPVSWAKKAQIVIDEVNTTLRPLKECFTPENGYPDDMFIPSQLALDEIDSHTALIVVDTTGRVIRNVRIC